MPKAAYAERREGIIRGLIARFGEFKKVVRMRTGVAYKVSTRDILEKGISEQDLDRFTPLRSAHAAAQSSLLPDDAARQALDEAEEILAENSWGGVKMIRQIPVKLPWSFEDALGYPRGFRWVAFFWEPCGDEAMFDDGYCSTGGNWRGFLAFVRHPSVAPWLTGYDLGSSENEATHWLLCDLEGRDTFVGERAGVKDFLVNEVKKYVPEGAPANSRIEISPEEMAKIRDEMQQVSAPLIAEIQDKMRRDKETVEKLVAELGEVK